MRKSTYINTLTYIYNADRKGAKYTLDGKHYMNHGEYCECLAKHMLGYEVSKDANTRFDMGEDIPELNASIKSWNCSLTDMKLGNTKEEFLAKFWEMSNATTYMWIDDYADMVDIWEMNETEFKAFIEMFGSWDNYSKKIRIKISINKIRTWLEDRI